MPIRLFHYESDRFNRSDIYFICRLEPLSFEIKRQESEIDECLWMPVDKFLDRDDVNVMNKEAVRKAMDSPGLRSMDPPVTGPGSDFEFFLPVRP